MDEEVPQDLIILHDFPIYLGKVYAICREDIPVNGPSFLLILSLYVVPIYLHLATIYWAVYGM